MNAYVDASVVLRVVMGEPRRLRARTRIRHATTSEQTRVEALRSLGRAIFVVLLALAGASCSEASSTESSSDAGLASDAKPGVTSDSATGCPSPMEPRPKDGTACPTAGLVCDVGSMSCWVKATCQPDNRWAITCGIVFPDGGPCC